MEGAAGNKTRLRVLVILIFILTILACASVYDRQQQGKDAGIPVNEVTISVGWSTAKARELNQLLSDLPKSFDDWQTATFHDSLVVHYAGELTKFSLTETEVHRLSIHPKKGIVRGVGVTLSPIIRTDLDDALELARQLNDQMRDLGLSEVDDPRFKVSSDKYVKARFELVDTKLLGARMGLWTDGRHYYSTSIERFVGESIYQSIDDENPTSKWAYSVNLNIRDTLGAD